MDKMLIIEPKPFTMGSLDILKPKEQQKIAKTEG